MNVSLTPELEKFVQQKLDEGLYGTASEVVRDGLRLLTERDEERRIKLEALRQQVGLGLAELDQGGVPGKQAFAAIRARQRARSAGDGAAGAAA